MTGTMHRSRKYRKRRNRFLRRVRRSARAAMTEIMRDMLLMQGADGMPLADLEHHRRYYSRLESPE